MSIPRNSENVPGSFRDPSGFLFWRDGALYRQINFRYKDHYDFFMQSGLYAALVKADWLIPHEEVQLEGQISENAYKIIQPEVIPFISYPYEWSFSQLKQAALRTLAIQKRAIAYGLSLKDCSAYNIQFRQGKPVLIDTLSFERYQEGRPWVAYRQFCQHFLAPLALMRYTDIRLNQLFRVYIDGVPLDLASTLLPFRTRLKFSLLMHLHLHAKSQQRFAGKTVKVRENSVSRQALLGIIDNLETAIRSLTWQPKGTEWAEYYEDTNYSVEALQHKKQLVAEFLDKVRPQNVWDFGANVGMFSRIASEKGIPTIAFDIDPGAVEKLYLDCLRQREIRILPLLLDLTNPSPGIGWQHQERMSLLERGPADMGLALALIHHLAISNNVPFHDIADFFRKICHTLIIEFVPKHDSQVQRLLVTREDIFAEYTQQAFERVFTTYFTIQETVPMRASERTLYLMQRR